MMNTKKIIAYAYFFTMNAFMICADQVSAIDAYKKNACKKKFLAPTEKYIMYIDKTKIIELISGRQSIGRTYYSLDLIKAVAEQEAINKLNIDRDRLIKSKWGELDSHALSFASQLSNAKQ